MLCSWCEPWPVRTPKPEQEKVNSYQYYFFTDLDGTMLGDDVLAERFLDICRRNRIAVIPVTARLCRNIRMHVLPLFPGYAFPALIGGIGTEIWHSDTGLDTGWDSCLRKNWDSARIISLLEKSGLPLQEKESLTDLKISCSITPDYIKDGAIERLKGELAARAVDCLVIVSQGVFLDILPSQAGKRKAIEYLVRKWGIETDRIMTAGDSQNDADILSMPCRSVIVGNAFPEIRGLRGDAIYPARGCFAAGLIEALEAWNIM